MAKRKLAIKTGTKVSASRVSAFTGMILLASMAIGAFLTAIFTK